VRKLFLTAAALGLFALASPASAMPIGKIAADVANADAGVTQVRYRRYRYSRGYYRPRVIRRYGYYGGSPSYYGPGGGPSYYGPGSGTGYGRGPSIGFSFGGGRW
jgi:hypothetical protein